MTEKHFRILVEQEQQRGLSLVAAIYRVNDRLTREANTARETPWACHKGCSYCCHQLVCATVIEWREIEMFFSSIKDPKKRYELKRLLKPRSREWRRWMADHPSITFDGKSGDSTMRVYKEWIERPCVFLGEEGECIIYPARPIDCRNAFSAVQCGQGEGRGERFPYEWNAWANNMILDEARRLAGQDQIVLLAPLPEWLEWLELVR